MVEAKTPVRPSVSWLDGAKQVHDDYERFVPELFACNVFSLATEGKDLRYGADPHPGGAVESLASRGAALRGIADSSPSIQNQGMGAGRYIKKQAGLKFLKKVYPLAAAPQRHPGYPGPFHPLRHRQEKTPPENRLPLPAVRSRQRDRPARAGRCAPQRA